MIKLLCPICNCEFEKALKEHTRNLKKQSKSMCGKPECMKKLGKISIKKRKTPNDGAYNIKTHCSNRNDEYSPFRSFLRRIRSYCKHSWKTFDVDLPYLKKLWEKQNGLCAITNMKMTLPQSTYVKHLSVYSASVDRIDSTKGYIKDNIQFVCYCINLAKNSFNDDEIKSFIETLVNSKNGGPTGLG